MFQPIGIEPEVSMRLPDVRVFGCRAGFLARPAQQPLDWFDDQQHMDDYIPRLVPRFVDWTPEWERLHAAWTGKTKADVAADPLLAAFIDLTRRIGLDPKRTPPSVVNLIQRFLMGPKLERFPRINPVVDAVNVAAVETRIPLGVFDAATVQGALRLAITIGGELFQPLGAEGALNLPTGVLVLRDDEKVLSQFGHRDGETQKVTNETRRIWLLGCQAAGVETAAVTAALEQAVARLRQVFELELFS